MNRSGRALVVISLMVVGACGSATEPSTPIAGDGSARTAVPRSTAPRGSPKQAGGGGVGTGAARSPKPSAGSDTGGSLFGRHDAPPGSVAQFLDFGTGGGGTCHDDPGPGSPTVNIEQPFPLSVCAYNFIPGESIDLVVRGPRGWRREIHLVPDDLGQFNGSSMIFPPRSRATTPSRPLNKGRLSPVRHESSSGC